MTDKQLTNMVFVDGTDALAYVIIRPGEAGTGTVAIDAAANGMGKAEAAYVLAQVAHKWAEEVDQAEAEQAAKPPGAGLSRDSQGAPTDGDDSIERPERPGQ